MTKTIYFDCETGSLPDEQLAIVKPEFTAPKNYKKPEAISEYLVQAETDWRERAALSAITGRVLAIGLLTGDDFQVIEGTELGILTGFWAAWEHNQDARFVGWFVKGFDLPFLFRRSLALSVPVPKDLNEGRYFNSRIVDLAEIWCCGNREQKESLDIVAKSLGIGAKNGDGKDFAVLWASDKEKAKEYLHNDLRLTAGIAKRMGF